MAGFFQQFLKGAADGFLGSPYFKDYKHASKTFTTNAYANAPKFKWLFHVYFQTNADIGFILPWCANSPNYGLLVKSIDLPKYTVAVQEMNQYNRKRLIQTKINYDPVRITFHDDNNNQIRNLWYTYYSYYYTDPSQPISDSGPGAPTVPGEAVSKLNKRNIYENIIDNQLNWGYQGEISNSNLAAGGSQKVPFFRSIKIYGFNQHNFALYELINPIIENFTHDTYSYAETTGTMENTMTIKYESVKYYEGAINGQKPGAIVEKFAEPGVYDTELSPIARPGNNKTILGQGGLVDAGLGVLSDLKNGNILGAIQTAGRASRTFKNSQDILQTAKTELVKGAISAVSNPQTVRSAFNFPAAGGTTGNGAQTLNSTNSTPTYAPPIQVPTNNQIPGGP